MTGVMNGFDLNTYSLYASPSPTVNAYKPRHCISLRMTGNPLTPHAILICELFWGCWVQDSLSLSLWCCCWCTRSLRAAPLPYFGLAGGDRDWASSIILLGVRVASLIKNPRLTQFGSAGTNVVTGSEEGNYCLLVIWYTAEARERQKKGWQTIKNNLNWWSVTYQ